MNISKYANKLMTVCAVGAALLCGTAFADEAADGADGKESGEEETPEGWHYTAGEGISFGEQPIVCAEVAVGVESKYLTYGLVDCYDPIVLATPEMTMFDWLALGADSYFGMTKYGKRAGYRNRGGKCFEFDPYLKLTHEFSPEDYEWLPTKVKATVGYMYEYHAKEWGNGPDTQYWWFKGSLPDLVIVPELWYERDTMRDNGTYVNLKLSHGFEFNPCEDVTFTVTPYVAQGFGNTQRVRGYLCDRYGEPLDHAGMMDTQIGVEFDWDICDNVNLWFYCAYSDYVLDREMREAARDYELTGRNDRSYNFVCGIYLTFYF